MKSLPTVEQIREKLGSDPHWLERGILAIYANQTADEQQSEATRHDNGIGFTGADAHFMSSLAKQIERSHRRPGDRLSPKQRAIAFERMPKYARQLHRVAKSRQNGDNPPVS
jgi:hypothetical protein